MRNTLPALLLAAMLAACGQARNETPPPEPKLEPSIPPIPMDAAAGPSGADSLTWMFDGPEENGAGRPRLMYSARASDKMALNLQCSEDAVQVLIVRNAPDVVPRSWSFALISGPHEAELVGQTEGEPASEMFVRAPLALSSPVLTNLRETGAISLREDDRVRVYDAINAQERAEISEFFAACGSRQ
jgi:hypothetical protein